MLEKEIKLLISAAKFLRGEISPEEHLEAVQKIRGESKEP